VSTSDEAPVALPDETAPTGPTLQRVTALDDLARLEPPRLVATDLDGTLLPPGGAASARTRAALAACEAAGVPVVFVTARPPRWLAEVAAHVGRHGTAICANGAAVVDVASARVVVDRGMPPDLVAELAARLRASGGGAHRVHLAIERADGFAAELGFVSQHPVPPGSPRADRIEHLVGPTTLKLLVRSESLAALPGGLAPAVSAAVGDLAEASDSRAAGLGEIGPPGVTKATTLATWAADLGLGPADVWAVGDAPNDLPMLRWAARAFAVADADAVVLDDVREGGGHVLPACADDGVALLLEAAAAATRRATGARLGSS
jgi:hydroxymethylpyrimidine pyrophosphatase-like HAD family hydrolase